MLLSCPRDAADHADGRSATDTLTGQLPTVRKAGLANFGVDSRR